MNTFVYVDGFNLYYGAVRGTPFKWLDIAKMCQLLLPNNRITRIKYFTARVSGRPGDPDQPTRQQTFLRALRTIPHLEIIYGHFLSNEVMMPLAGSPPGTQKYAKVIKTEEKGSEVRIVRDELKKTVGILNPHAHPSRVLARHASFIKPIRKGVLAASQFAPTIRDAQGLITKPASW